MLKQLLLHMLLSLLLLRGQLPIAVVICKLIRALAALALLHFLQRTDVALARRDVFQVPNFISSMNSNGASYHLS